MTELEIVNYYTTQGVGVAGTNIFYGDFSEAYPDAVTVIRVYSGLADEPNTGDDANSGKLVRLAYPSVQTFVRGARDDYDGPQAICRLAHSAMMRILNTTLSGTRYLSAEPQGEPWALKRDDNFRWYFTFSTRITKEPS